MKEQEEFLRAVANIVKSWDQESNKTSQEKLRGCAFSILALLDGEHAMMPGYVVTPINGNEDIAGGLHEKIYNYFEEN